LLPKKGLDCGLYLLCPVGWLLVSRRDILLKTADIFMTRMDEFVWYMCEETGSQAPFAEFIVMFGANLLKDDAGKVSVVEATSPMLT
jgi:acyl-CoA reductase-like NAD-dependent aldehyde dehydrogenase